MTTRQPQQRSEPPDPPDRKAAQPSSPATPTPPGNPASERPLEDLLSGSYPDLHTAAGNMLKRERRSHTLSPTALVNEVFLRLARQRKRSWESREGFLAAAAVMMKRILSNHGRDRNTLKRGGKAVRVPLDETLAPGVNHGGSTAKAVRVALEKLRDRDPRAADIAELRLYRGLGHGLIAESLGLSRRTVEREWAAAKAWLRAELAEEERA